MRALHYELRNAVQQQCDCRAVLRLIEAVDDVDVYIFDLDGHPDATRAYAWSLPVPGAERRRYFIKMHLGEIRSAADAVAVKEH